MKKYFISSLMLISLLSFSASAQAQSINSNNASSYDRCMEIADGDNIKMTNCIVEESDRMLKILEKKYQQMANSKQYQNWHQGAGMFSGNFKELFSSWLEYRDKYCSLYGYSVSPDVEQGNIAQLTGAECVLELTKRQNKDMDVILQNMARSQG